MKNTNKPPHQRVNYDRNGMAYETNHNVQSKDVSIGPESNLATRDYVRAYEQDRWLYIPDMNPLYREGRHVQQYVFKGDALANLATYQKSIFLNPNRLQGYAEERSPLSKFHPNYRRT